MVGAAKISFSFNTTSLNEYVLKTLMNCEGWWIWGPKIFHVEICYNISEITYCYKPLMVHIWEIRLHLNVCITIPGHKKTWLNHHPTHYYVIFECFNEYVCSKHHMHKRLRTMFEAPVGPWAADNRIYFTFSTCVHFPSSVLIRERKVRADVSQRPPSIRYIGFGTENNKISNIYLVNKIVY